MKVPPNMSKNFVNRLIKLGAAVLVLMLFSTPLVALVNCSPKAAMAGHCGGEDCPMMHARQQSNTQISEAPSGDGSCCQMSSLPPSPTRPAATSEARVLVQPSSSQAVTVSAAPVGVSAQVSPVLLLAAGPPPQALLCVFLV